jgi:glycyl-tRNA synthetase beta chain
MVKEFTDLQGVVGGLYAKHQGENEDVSRAIYEHYKPLSMDDSIPSTRAGQILALADKLDNLREFFRIGMEPTGSKDPFALRRAAQGVVRILVERDFPVELEKFCQGPLLAFMMDRIRYYFREVRGFKYDEVNAATAGRHRYLYELERCLEAIRDIRPTEDFERVAAGFKRIKNILEQANFTPTGSVDEGLIEDGAEQDLYNEFHRIVYCDEPAVNYDFSESLTQFAALRPAIDAYFDKVMVNAKDERVRANRLTMLHRLFHEFSTIADFSEIVTSGDQK